MRNTPSARKRRPRTKFPTDYSSTNNHPLDPQNPVIVVSGRLYRYLDFPDMLEAVKRDKPLVKKAMGRSSKMSWITWLILRRMQELGFEVEWGWYNGTTPLPIDALPPGVRPKSDNPDQKPPSDSGTHAAIPPEAMDLFTEMMRRSGWRPPAR